MAGRETPKDANGFPGDAILVEEFLRGDPAAFEGIMKRYRRMVYFVALRMVGNHDDADDVAQKTFISAYKNLRNFRRESSLKTWLFRIATNFSKNLLRDRGRRRGEQVTEASAVTSSPAPDRLEKEQQRKIVADAVKGLPNRQREVFHLRVSHELSFAEIADVIGCSVSAAKVNYHYAVKSLKGRISPV